MDNDKLKEDKLSELTCSGWQCVMTGADGFIDTGKTKVTKSGYTLHYLECTKCGQKDWYLYLSQPRRHDIDEGFKQ